MNTPLLCYLSCSDCCVRATKMVIDWVLRVNCKLHEEWISCNFQRKPLAILNKVFYKQLPLKTSTVCIHYIWYSTSAYYCPALLGCPSLNYAITSNHQMVDFFSIKYSFYLGNFWMNLFFVVRICRLILLFFQENFNKFLIL